MGGVIAIAIMALIIIIKNSLKSIKDNVMAISMFISGGKSKKLFFVKREKKQPKNFLIKF